MPCHSNQQRHGRGHGHKAADCFFAAACPEAHDYLDGRKGGWSKEEKHTEWERAYIATQRFLWENSLIEVKK